MELSLKVGEMNVEQSRRTWFWAVVVKLVALRAKQQWQDSLVNGHLKSYGYYVLTYF